MGKTKYCTRFFFTIVLLDYTITRVLGTPQVPAMFVFGDSLIDNGNNNYPYGIDFFQGATGRFCNGKTVVDVLCDLLGLPYPPPFSTPWLNGSSLISGVNYASAAAGILDESGQFLGDRMTLNQQVLNFEINLNALRAVLGPNLPQFLARSIVVMVFGSNDYINNYLLPSLYPSSYNYSPEDFANLLLNRYTTQIDALRSLGLRKFFLPGVGPLGCIPNQRASGQAPPDRCVDRVNEMVGYFNRGLRSLVDQLNCNHTGSIFVYANTYAGLGDILNNPKAYAGLGDILNNPKAYGFTVIDSGCCGISDELHSDASPLRGPEPACFLGCIPPYSSSEPVTRTEGVQLDSEQGRSQEPNLRGSNNYFLKK